MKRFSLILSVMALVALLVSGIQAATGDLWTARGSLSSVYRDLVRVTSTGAFVPGQNNVQGLGSSSLRWSSIYTYQTHRKGVAVTTNTTLTVSSGQQVRIGSVSGNITLTLPSAVTAGDGAVIDLQDVGGVLDSTHTVTVNSTSGSVNGNASGVNVSTAYSGKQFISDGTNWFAR